MNNLKFLKDNIPFLSHKLTPVNFKIAYEPHLIPPPDLMKDEGIEVLEEWFRWAEEWSMILKIYGKITKSSVILEIGCGLGRIAFPLRYVLFNGSYEGFDICRYKIDFLQKNFHSTYSNFNFRWANIKNTHYNPDGEIEATSYRFPYDNESFDLVYAASVFTHMIPQNTANYFKESARVLKPNGQCIFSFFILDYYRKGKPRPLGFSNPYFDFDYYDDNYNDDFAVNDPKNPEKLTAYKLDLVKNLAERAGLKLIESSLPGVWSGSTENWIGAQDLVILRKNN